MSTRRSQATTKRVFIEPAPSRVQLAHLRELVEKTQDLPGDAAVVLSGLRERITKDQWTAQFLFIESTADAPTLPRLVTTADELATFHPGSLFRSRSGRIYTQIQMAGKLRLDLAGEGWFDHAEVIESEKELLALWEPEGDA